MTLIPWYLKKINVSIIPFFDLVAIFAPLLQSISRIGCFFAGCCYGIPTTSPWGISYSDTNTVAPLHLTLHPTQLYSSLALLGIFLFMYFILQHTLKKTGQLFAAYLILASTERFIIDLWRADRVLVTNILVPLSFTQVIAMGIFIFAVTIFGIINYISLKKSDLA